MKNELQTQGVLSPFELAELTEWLSGQFSDGWGEGLEQREIKVDDGELYVSFWDSSDRFFIKQQPDLRLRHVDVKSCDFAAREVMEYQ